LVVVVAIQTARPLSVRSAILSVLLGCYPEAFAARRLVAVGRAFGMGESAVRVALTRGLAAGDLERTDEGYRIGPRQFARFAEQREAVAAEPHAWDGAWETAIVVAAARTAPDRVALRATLGRHRLAELREGVWLRPANLVREPAYADHPDLRACESRHPDPAALAAELWDLDAWAVEGRRLVAGLAATDDPARRLTAAALLVRHLRTDPILPAELLPDGWPGQELRAVYDAYQRELRDLAAGL